jgi:protocatechuate 3,4-dioxygenase beta subunit
MHDHQHDPDDLTERGLAFDLTTMTRRRALAFFGAGAGAVALAACSGSESASPATTGTPGTTAGTTAAPTPAATSAAPVSSSAATVASTAPTTATATAAPTTGSVATTAAGTAATVTDEIPDETAGPFPGDGSNGPDVLAEADVVRSDIRQSVGAASGVADGVPLTFTLSVVDVASMTPLAGAAVYVWHCDAEGRYSMYSDGATEENYLRGVLETDASGNATFQSIFPGCYPGRWPHIHFEVYASVADATGGGEPIKTSQLAFDQTACEAVYTDARYPGSASSLADLSLATDGVFRDDGGIHQLAVTTGGNDAGYVSTLGVGV